MFYTKKGDKGVSNLWGCDEKLLKDSPLAEALGTVDEVNSLLGLCKIKAKGLNFGGKTLPDIVGDIQNDLFVVQAELGGAPKHIEKEDIEKIEKIIDGIEQSLPPVHSFFVAGGSEASALFDFARAVSRRAERDVVAVSRERKISENTVAYMNRLSSILYALARLANNASGEKEEAPSY